MMLIEFLVGLVGGVVIGFLLSRRFKGNDEMTTDDAIEFLREKGITGLGLMRVKKE